MMKSKKLLSMLLAIVMMLSMGCVGVFAEDIAPQSVTPSTAVKLNTNSTNQINYREVDL